jgi:hypothetical protein
MKPAHSNIDIYDEVAPGTQNNDQLQIVKCTSFKSDDDRMKELLSKIDVLINKIKDRKKVIPLK